MNGLKNEPPGHQLAKNILKMVYTAFGGKRNVKQKMTTNERKKQIQT
jgi:hypothetical protein